MVATAVGNCFRYEAINLTSLERLWNFTMREVIFVGAKDFVLENREIARQRMSQVFERIGLAYRVESANDPFFIGEFRKQAAFQSAFQLKFEIRARLPFKDCTLAVGSYNYHQDFLRPQPEHHPAGRLAGAHRLRGLWPGADRLRLPGAIWPGSSQLAGRSPRNGSLAETDRRMISDER